MLDGGSVGRQLTPCGKGGLFFLPRLTTTELGVIVTIICESVCAEWGSSVDVEEDGRGDGDGWQSERHR